METWQDLNSTGFLHLTDSPDGLPKFKFVESPVILIVRKIGKLFKVLIIPSFWLILMTLSLIVVPRNFLQNEL